MFILKFAAFGILSVARPRMTGNKSMAESIGNEYLEDFAVSNDIGNAECPEKIRLNLFQLSYKIVYISDVHR